MTMGPGETYGINFELYYNGEAVARRVADSLKLIARSAADISRMRLNIPQGAAVQGRQAQTLARVVKEMNQAAAVGPQQLGRWEQAMRRLSEATGRNTGLGKSFQQAAQQLTMLRQTFALDLAAMEKHARQTMARIADAMVAVEEEEEGGRPRLVPAGLLSGLARAGQIEEAQAQALAELVRTTAKAPTARNLGRLAGEFQDLSKELFAIGTPQELQTEVDRVAAELTGLLGHVAGVSGRSQDLAADAVKHLSRQLGAVRDINAEERQRLKTLEQEQRVQAAVARAARRVDFPAQRRLLRMQERADVAALLQPVSGLARDLSLKASAARTPADLQALRAAYEQVTLAMDRAEAAARRSRVQQKQQEQADKQAARARQQLAKAMQAEKEAMANRNRQAAHFAERLRGQATSTLTPMNVRALTRGGFDLKGLQRDLEAFFAQAAVPMSLKDDLERLQQTFYRLQGRLNQAGKEAQRFGNIWRTNFARTDDEIVALNRLSSVMQGLMLGMSVAQGSVMGMAFSLIFMRGMIIKLMVSVAALAVAVTGLVAVVRGALASFRELQDKGLLLQRALAGTADAVRDFAGMMDYARTAQLRWGSDLSDTVEGLRILQQEGLRSQEIVNALRDAEAATGKTFSQVAQEFTQAVGRERGALEGLRGLGVDISEDYTKGQKVTTIGTRGQIGHMTMAGGVNELDRSQRLDIALQALTKHQGAADEAAGTISGSLRRIGGAFAYMGQTIGRVVNTVVGPAFNAIANFLADLARDIEALFAPGSAALRLWEATVQDLRDGFASLFPEAQRTGNLLKDVLLGAVLMVTRALRVLAAVFKVLTPYIRAVGQAIGFMLAAFKGLLNFFSPVLGTIKEAIDRFLTFLQTIKEVHFDGVPVLAGFLTFVRSFADDVVKSFAKIATSEEWQALKQVFDDIGKLGSRITSNVTSMIRVLINEIELWFRGKKVPNIGQLIDDALKAARDFVIDIPAMVLRFGKFIFGEEGRNLGDDILEFIRNALTVGLRGLGSLGKNLLTGLGKAGLVGLAFAIIETIGDAIIDLMGGEDNALINSLKGALTLALTGLAIFLGTSFGWVAALGAAIIGGIAGYFLGEERVNAIFEGIWNALVNAFDLVRRVITGETSIFGAIGEVFSGIGNFLGGLLSSAWETIIGIVSGWPGAIAGALSGLWALVSNAWNEFSNGIILLVTAVFQWLQRELPTWPGKIGEFFRQIPYWVGYAWSFFSQTIEDAVRDTWAWLAAEVPTWPGKIGSFLNSLWNMVEPYWTAFKDEAIARAAGLWTWITEEVPTWPGKIGEFLSSLWEQAQSYWEDLKAGVKEKLREAWEWIAENVPTWPDAIAGFFMNMPEAIARWFNETKDRMYQAFADFFTWAEQNIPTWPQQIVDWIKTLPDLFAPVAESIFNAIVDPFKRAWEFIANTWNDITRLFESGEKAGREAAARSRSVGGNPGPPPVVRAVLEPDFGYAAGGLALTPQLATIAELGPEAVLPLEYLSNLGGNSLTIVVSNNTFAGTGGIDDFVDMLERRIAQRWSRRSQTQTIR